MRSQITRRPGARSAARAAVGVAVLAAMVLGAGGCAVSTFSTDVPVAFHRVLRDKYEGRRAWTRRTLEDEKKNIKIEQDQEVIVRKLGLVRNGSVTLESKKGRKRLVFPFNLPRPLTLESYEKALLDVLWFTSPEERYAEHKKKYGTRIADAIRDHKILKDMTQMMAYLSWGPPTEVTAVIRRGLDEQWDYDTPNLRNARIIFRGGKVTQWTGENVSDTEAAKKRRRLRRSS